MIKEIYYFLRYGPASQKLQAELGPAEFQMKLAKDADADGYAQLRTNLVGDLKGDILEIGSGTGATFSYYGCEAHVTAVEPHDELRAAAQERSKSVEAKIDVCAGEGESLPFEDGAFDVVVTSTVLCSVASPSKTLKEFKRVLKPNGRIRLMEHVRSEHWAAGPLMHWLNPLWLKVNKVGCHWNRKTVEDVKSAGFQIKSVEPYKVYSKAAPATFPLRIIKADK